MSRNYYIIPIFVTHRGCPHKCVFCNQKSITGKSGNVTGEDVRKIAEDYLKTIDMSNNPTVEISFFGGSFTGIPMEKQNELLEVAKEFKDKGLVKYIRMSTRPDYIDDTILSNLKKYSVDIIELGVQSMDKEVLIKSERGHTREDVIKASHLIKKYNITLGLQMMLGLPGDTAEKDIETAKEFLVLKPEMVRIYPSLVIKNTPMEDLYHEGKYTPYSLDYTIKVCKSLLGIFTANDINVIRIGLQPTYEINYGRELVAGPFHPSIREIVEGGLINDMVYNKISETDGKNFEIVLNPKTISKLYCNKKKFFNDMQKKLFPKKLSVIQSDNVEKESLTIRNESNSINMSFKNYTISKFKEGYFYNL